MAEHHPAIREDLLGPRALHRFLRRLNAIGRRRIVLDDLWAAYHAVYGNHATGIDARAEVIAVLQALECQGQCRLPSSKGRCWDRTSAVTLPRWIQLKQDRGKREQEWRRFPWRPELAWVSHLAVLPEDHLSFLMAVQRGLVEGQFSDRAPLKYRSLQLTGDEKRLETYLGMQLFADGRLSLDVLNCDGPWLPLAWERVGVKPHLIIFENAGSFLVARRVLAGLSDPPFGMVAYGGGFQILKAVPYLSVLGAIELIQYVGDLDAKGLAIGAQFARQVNAEGSTHVMPATRVHQAMLNAAAQLGAPQGWPAITDSCVRDEALWVAPEIKGHVADVIARGRRVPEEVLHDGHLLALWE